MAGDLFDKRQELYRSHFAIAKPYAEFIASGEPNHQKKWRSFEEIISLTPAQEQLLGGFTRTVNVLILAGTWCGDCARQCPMFAAIEKGSPKVTFRFLDNAKHPEIADELRIHGASRVPAGVVLSEDFFEVARLGDRTLSAYRAKAEREFGPACDAGIVPPNPEALAVELGEWVDQIERAHLLLRLSGMLRKRYND